MSDTQVITINNLTIPVSIGVNDWEKQLQQQLLFSIELEVDVSKAMINDVLHYTIDYTEVAKIVEITSKQKHFHLIEHLSHEILQNLSSFTQLKKATLVITKPKVVPNSDSVSFKASMHYR